MKKILVCGGRDYTDRDHVFAVLDGISVISPISAIIHGGARGADALGKAWAETWGIPDFAFPADWSRGKIAGPARNYRMLVEGRPDLVVAFPGGKGTANMVGLAKKHGVEVMEAARCEPPPRS